MEETIAEKDVGVTIDNKLSFDKHITEKVNKANSIIGVIRRTFEYLDLKTFRMLYVRLVRPHLEYVNPVWNPYLKKHIDMIENIQRRATKLIPGLSDLSYEDRLRRLKLPSLSYRRSRGDMIEVYKIMSGQGSQNCMWAWWSYWKECQSSLIFYCKIPNLCQSLEKSAQILLVMSDRTDTSHKLWVVNMILKFQTFSNIKNKKTVTPEDINTNYSNQDVD